MPNPGQPTRISPRAVDPDARAIARARERAEHARERLRRAMERAARARQRIKQAEVEHSHWPTRSGVALAQSEADTHERAARMHDEAAKAQEGAIALSEEHIVHIRGHRAYMDRAAGRNGSAAGPVPPRTRPPGNVSVTADAGSGGA